MCLCVWVGGGLGLSDDEDEAVTPTSYALETVVCTQATQGNVIMSLDQIVPIICAQAGSSTVPLLLYLSLFVVLYLALARCALRHGRHE